jgi:uncharacterized protein (DUF433 family)
MNLVMATAAAEIVFPHISKDPKVCSGRPCVEGTRVRVVDVVFAYEQGRSPVELQNYFDTRPLTLGEIHAALAYYNDHKTEIEADIAADERLTAEGLAKEAESLKHRSGQ